MPILLTWKTGSILYFSPEIFLSLAFCTLLALSVFDKNTTTNKLMTFMLASLFVGFILTLVVLIKFNGLEQSQLVLMNNFVIDKYTLWSKLFILFLSAISVYIFQSSVYTRFKKVPAEFLIILGFSVTASLFLISSFNWGLLFLSLEFLGICTYCLLSLLKKDSYISIEATIKYFAISALSSCFLLVGIFFFYTIFLDISFFAYKENFLLFTNSGNFLKVVTFTLLISFLIKLGCAPFHMWVPDVYEGVPTFMTFILSVVTKTIFFLFFVRLVSYLLFFGVSHVQFVLTMTAAFSIIVGCFGALFQKKIKRILAYSSINNMGYMLLGLSLNTVEGTKFALMYAVFYFLAVTLVFMVILGTKELDTTTNANKSALVYVTDLPKLTKGSKTMLMFFSLALFSLAGIPPLSGFFIKFFILSSAMSAQLYFLAVVGALTSVVSAFYYVNLIKLTHFSKDNPSNAKITSVSPGYVVVCGILTIGLIAIFLFPGALDNFFYSLSIAVTYPLA